MPTILARLDNFFEKKLWEMSPESHGRPGKFLIVFLRLLYKVGKEFSNGEIPRRASSLVYTTLLTIVPLLAVSFSVLKAFRVHNMMEPMIKNFLSPLGEKGDQITVSIVGYVDRINVGLLGTVGLATLIYTVINSVQKVEGSFNYLWQIETERSLLRRFRDYTGVLLLGPILIVAALGITTSVMSHSVAQRISSLEPFGTALLIVGKLIPYVLTSVAFALLYYLLPNTKVNLKSAFAGGICAGILWQTVSWAFATFIVSSAQYSAVYSGLAIVLLFMVWLYYNWAILLTGAKISFYHQFSVLMALRDDRMLFSVWHTQRLAVVLMCLIGQHYFHDKPRWTLQELLRHLRLPKNAVQYVLGALKKEGLLLEIERDGSFAPSRDIGTITLSEVVHSVSGESRGPFLSLKDLAAIPRLEDILGETEEAVEAILVKTTVRELVISQGETQNHTGD